MRVNSFRKTLATISLLSLTLSAFNALAGDTADLLIKGRFMPTSCDINLSQGTIDVGDIKYGELTKKRSGVGKKNFIKDVGVYDNASLITVTVSCDSLASAGFKITDDLRTYAPWNLLGTNIDDVDLSSTFALVTTSGLSKATTVGGYYFEYDKTTATDENGNPIPDASSAQIKKTALAWLKKLLVGDSEDSMYWTHSDSAMTDAIKAKTFTQKIKPVLYFYYDSTQQTATDIIEFEGKSTFTLYYI